MANLNDIKQKLEQMKFDAAHLDRQRGEHHLPLFDSSLFTCRSRLLTPCVEEAIATFTAIEREKEHQLLTIQRAEYLTERLLAQISAIQRELSTSHFRKDEPKHASYYRKPINQLYQELSQHKEWERRLMDIVVEKHHHLEQHTGFNHTNAQQAVLKAEQRLERCRQAIIKIEKQITFREQHQ